MSDEPTAVVFAGARGSGHGALVNALLSDGDVVIDVPAGSYLVARHGPQPEAYAYVPGARQPQEFDLSPADQGELPRPPRRVEVMLPDQLLRHFTIVEAPDVEALGVAGTRVLLDVAIRGGGLAYVVSARRGPSRAELDLLAEVAAHNITVFFALTPDPAARSRRWDDRADAVEPERDVPPFAVGSNGDVISADPHATALQTQRALIAERLPELADAPWFAVDPTSTDTAYLRRALVEWAGVEALRRAGAAQAYGHGVRPVRTDPGAAESGWSELLRRLTRTSAQVVRQRLAIELAHIHLRCVQDLVFGGGCPGLPAFLDRELHALSLRATQECDDAVTGVLDQVLHEVLGTDLEDGVRRRVAAAVRQGIADDADAQDLVRVLLVTSTGGVATVSGAGALAALSAYEPDRAQAVLPAVGLGLSGGCYLLWRNPVNADTNKARSWLQRAIRGIELDLLRDITRRFDVVQTSFGALVGETVDHGMLLI